MMHTARFAFLPTLDARTAIYKQLSWQSRDDFLAKLHFQRQADGSSTEG
jgi:hypothetical protein